MNKYMKINKTITASILIVLSAFLYRNCPTYLEFQKYLPQLHSVSYSTYSVNSQSESEL